MIKSFLSDLYASFILSFGMAIFIITLAIGFHVISYTIEIVEGAIHEARYGAEE